MAFRPADLQEAFFVPRTHGYRVWGYGTLDALEEVLRAGYFAGTLLQPGELIYVSARRRNGAASPEPGDVHMALLMVVRGAERRAGRRALTVRLVQDFGCPEDMAQPTMATAAPAHAAAPVKRGRGRPPGSRTRKNGTMPAMSVN